MAGLGLLAVLVHLESASKMWVTSAGSVACVMRPHMG
jgi:hypothetical protein